MMRVTLSRPLPIVALVSHYLTNKLIGRSPVLRRNLTFDPEMLSGITARFQTLSPDRGRPGRRLRQSALQIRPDAPAHHPSGLRKLPVLPVSGGF